MKKDVVIIGAGLGGLFTGAILSKEGYRVTILEKNSTIGGGLQSFKRFGMSFDTGMHVIGGMQPGGNIRRLCEYLNISDKIKLQDVDNDCSEFIHFEEDNSSYKIRKGRKGFVESFALYFPEDREDLEKYVDALFAITDSVDLFNLRPNDNSTNLFAHFPGDFLLSANRFIEKYIKNEKLASILAYLNPLYGGCKDITPAYIHAIISVLYINGTSRFIGGSDLFAELLQSIVTKNGGKVFTNEGVTWIDVENRHINGVATSKGNKFYADYYISDIHPCTLLKIMPETAFPKAFRDRINMIPNSFSAFSLFIKMKDNWLPYINHTEFFMTKYQDIWSLGSKDISWPSGFLFMTPPELNQGEYAKKVIITSPMNFEYAKEWEMTSVGKRGPKYQDWKCMLTNLLLDKVEYLHPGFKQHIEAVNSATPLTIRDFYGTKEGSLYGFSKDCNNITMSQLPVVTKVDNLLLTGQNNGLHGFCGVALTAINTCEAILGGNYILNKISQCVSY